MADKEIQLATREYQLLKPGETAFSKGFVWCALIVGQKPDTDDIIVAHATPTMMLDCFRPENVLPHVLAEHEPTMFNLMSFLLTPKDTVESSAKPIKVTTVSRKDELNSPKNDLTWREFKRVADIVLMYDEEYLRKGPNYLERKSDFISRETASKWDRGKLRTASVSPHHIPSIGCGKFQARITNDPDGLSLTVKDGDTEKLLLQISHGILKQSALNNE